MRISISLLTITSVIALFILSENRFLTAGGSDSAERVVMLHRGVRMACAAALALAILWLVYAPSIWSIMVTVLLLACFTLSQNTVRFSGKSFEVVQSLSLFTIKRFAVIEGNGNVSSEVFAGVWPLRLPQQQLERALDGMTKQ